MGIDGLLGSCTVSSHGHRIYPNLMQNLAVTGPNQAWVADITYIAIRNAFVYLAVILARIARRVVKYAVSCNINTALCLEALQMTIADRRPPGGIVHHFDRGVQYASDYYVEVFLKHGFRISMSRKDNPYDNAAESFFKTVKSEEVYLWEYQTLGDVQIRLPFLSTKYTTASGCTTLSDTDRLWNLKNYI